MSHNNIFSRHAQRIVVSTKKKNFAEHMYPRYNVDTYVHMINEYPDLNEILVQLVKENL